MLPRSRTQGSNLNVQRVLYTDVKRGTSPPNLRLGTMTPWAPHRDAYEHENVSLLFEAGLGKGISQRRS